MSANLDNLRAAHDALTRQDHEGFTRLTHPDVAGYTYVTSAEATRYAGTAGMRQLIDDLFSVWPDYSSRVVEAEEYGDALIARLAFSGTTRASGITVSGTSWQAVRLHDGKAIWFAGYPTREAALAAVGVGP